MKESRIPLKQFSFVLLVAFSLQAVSPSFLLAQEDFVPDEAAPQEEPQLSKEEKIKILRHEQDNMKWIYQDEKANLKDALDVRLQEIQDNEESSGARREAIQKWKQDSRGLKSAFRQAWNENADEISNLQGRTARHRSSAIQMFEAPPSVAQPARARRKGRCRRKRRRRRRSCRTRRRCR